MNTPENDTTDFNNSMNVYSEKSGVSTTWLVDLFSNYLFGRSSKMNAFPGDGIREWNSNARVGAHGNSNFHKTNVNVKLDQQLTGANLIK